MHNRDIPRFARQYAERCGTSPVNLMTIARSEGVKLIKNSVVHTLDTDEQGRAVTDGKGWIIIYDDLLTLDKRQFTLAHELGHIFLRHHEEYIKLMQYVEDLKKAHGRYVEIQADIFAESLLNVHTPKIKTKNGGLKMNIANLDETKRLALNVEELAEALGISKPTAYDLVRRKDFPSIRLSERRIIIPVGPLKAWLETEVENAR